MKGNNLLEQFEEFKIYNPKYIYGGDGDDGPVIDKTKKKTKGRDIAEEEEN